jgi:predicted DNA-binding transcriptional regulator AlpA
MSAKKTAPAKQPTITPEVAEKLRAAQISNIVRKVREGKTLTAAESRLLEVAANPEEDRELVTVTRISELFQVSRKTIYEWRKEGRDIPEPIGKKEDLAAWRAWFAANPSAGHYDGKPRRDRETLLCEKLEIEIDLKKIEREQELKRLVAMADVQENMTRITSAARSELLKLVSDMPPMLAGLDENAVKSRLKLAVFAVLDRLSDSMSEAYANENPGNT